MCTVHNVNFVSTCISYRAQHTCYTICPKWVTTHGSKPDDTGIIVVYAVDYSCFAEAVDAIHG